MNGGAANPATTAPRAYITVISAARRRNGTNSEVIAVAFGTLAPNPPRSESARKRLVDVSEKRCPMKPPHERSPVSGSAGVPTVAETGDERGAQGVSNEGNR